MPLVALLISPRCAADSEPVTSGPTSGATEQPELTWAASPGWARFVRVVLLVAPLVFGWSAVQLVGSSLWRPEGWQGAIAWLVQAVAVASVVAIAVDRVAMRFTPMVSLLGMSLTFPDHAPSRFGIALRSGTLSQLKARVDELNSDGLSSDVNTAAQQAVELVGLLSRHERLTRGHTERVRAYADLIAEELELSDDDRQKLAWAALLHDIGKLTVPAGILNKDGRPTDEEWEILKAHPAAGEAYLEPLAEWLGDWRLATVQHHERWDGGGYPLGLAGDEISLAGRIVAVADAFDVITSRRSYKAPMSAEAARRELVACAGTQFDPAIVRALLRASLGQRLSTARFAWVMELPGVSNVLNGLSTVPTTTQTAAPTTPPPSDCDLVRSGANELAGADLNGCDLSGLTIDQINLAGATLTGADLTGTTISFFNLEGANLDDATLTDARLSDGSFADATLRNVTATDLRMDRVDLARSTITNADLRSAVIDRVSFEFADVSGTNLSGAVISNAKFIDSVIVGTSFAGGDLRGLEFWRANATGASFAGTDLRGARLDAANATTASFDDARLEDATIWDTELNGSSLLRANLHQAIGVPFNSASASFGATTCPNGTVSSSDCWG